ncbi:MAG TPA: nicotinate-nucleotide adenylyltransferase [Roseiflexaceae bacterium]|nr:nicotinate-nucleotide adenylyltransferase [Roseiflexaceae bacterium]HMP39329.1 nicotinate-nucleotide adenylyltransferase [Roseiflexaceae bacterium]
MTRRVGVLGGTFDPIHYAHLAIAEEARLTFGLDRVFFVPAAHQPLKAGVHGASPTDRLAMTRHAIADNPAFEVSPLEIERSGPSYTAVTLEQLSREVSGELFFILGLDVLVDLPRWHAAERVVEYAQLIGVGRPGATFDAMALFQALPGLRGRLHLIDGPGMALASSTIRRRIAAGLSIRYLTPDAVVAYIEERQLYRES